MATRKSAKVSKKELILEAAIRQVSAGGLKSMTIRSIADELGGASSVMYYHFKDLDELIVNVNSRTIHDLDSRLAAAAATADRDVSALFRSLALAYLSFAVEKPMLFSALFEHRMAGDASIPEWHANEHYALFRHIDAPLVALGLDISDKDRRILARTIYSAVHGIVHLALHGTLMVLPLDVIEKQLTLVTKVMADGLACLPRG